MKVQPSSSNAPVEVLAKPGSVQSPEDFQKMPLEYRELAIHLMKVHTEGELTGADDYTQVFYNIAPNAYEKLVCCERAAEEIEHYQLSAKVLSDLGVDTSYMLAQNYLQRPLYANELVRGVKTWMERGIFSFLGEAVVLEHLQEFVDSSYAPFAEIFTRQIISDEHTHIAHGYRIIHEACQTESGRAEVQEALDRFWPHLLKLFGRAESPRTLQYIKWGLRKTSNDELRQKFLNKTVPRLQVLGLKVPEPVRGDAALAEV